PLCPATTRCRSCPDSVSTAPNWKPAPQMFSFAAAHYSSFAVGFCGDGICASGESPNSCSADCGPPGPGGPGCPSGGCPTPTPTATPSPTVEPTVAPTTEPTVPPGEQTPSGEVQAPENANQTPVCSPGAESTIQTKRVIQTFSKQELQDERVITRFYSVITLTVTNIGNSPVSSIRIEENLPDGNAVFSQQPVSIKGRKATWFIQLLSPGQSKEFSYTMDRIVGSSEFTEGVKAIAQPTVVAASAADYTMLYVVIAVEMLIAAVVIARKKLSGGKKENQEKNSSPAK
ncbi:MAG: hypothetical protein V1717_00125, partial [Candidatus Micrarchaeota archaeon]